MNSRPIWLTYRARSCLKRRKEEERGKFEFLGCFKLFWAFGGRRGIMTGNHLLTYGVREAIKSVL